MKDLRISRMTSPAFAQAANEKPKPGLAFHGPYTATSGGPFYTYGNFQDYCETGAWGDVSLAGAEKGKLVFLRAVEKIAVFLAEFIKET